MAATKISLKLLIDKKRNRVVFAEAGKDFVDFLFQVFSLPMVTITRLLKNEDMAGCLQSLYDGVENLSDTFFQRGAVSKDMVLKPKLVLTGGTDSLLLPSVESYIFTKFRLCRTCVINGTFKIITGARGNYCINCWSSSLLEVSLNDVDVEGLISENKEISGKFNFVKESVAYMVMDDLKLKPMCANTFTTLLSYYNIKELGAIEEKVVALGVDECVKLLKSALQSKTALTDVFLPRPSQTEEDSNNTSGTSEGPKKGTSVFLPD